MRNQVILSIILYVLLIDSHAVFSQTKSNSIKIWPYSEISYAIAYLYNLNGNLGNGHAIVKSMDLDSSVLEDHIHILNGKQLAFGENLYKKPGFNNLIRGLDIYYIPHHGIVFYDQANCPIAYLTVCFYCSAIKIFPEVKQNPVKSNQLNKEFSTSEINTALKLLKEIEILFMEFKLPIFRNLSEYKSYANNLKKKEKK